LLLQVCLTEFKKRVKHCGGCGKDIQHDATAFINVSKQSSGVTEVKGFCSRACLAKMNSDAVNSGSRERSAPCSVCSKVAPVRREISLGGVVHHLCSDPCFSAFRYANQLPADVCDECQTSSTADVLAANTIQFDGSTRKFCGSKCLSSFRNRRQAEIACEWCGARRSNFDMIERVDNDGRLQRFCSLNCLSLYRVNLQANSGLAVQCDQCHSCIPAQYHLTMSDASVRNFCSYPCVAAFQAQFAVPATSSTGASAIAAPTPGQKVTANTANTPASTAAPPPAKTSVYGTRQSTRGNIVQSSLHMLLK
jgi:zinc finger MYM-type protein 2/3/4